MFYLTTAIEREPSDTLALQAAVEYGYLHSDQLSINGAFLAARAGNMVMNFASKMEKYCPEAMMLIFANPVAVYSAAVSNYTKIKALGICAGFGNHLWDLSRICGRDCYDDWNVVAAGVNHLSFILRGQCQGYDMYEILKKYLTADWHPMPINSLDYGDQIREGLQKIVDVYRRFGTMIFSSEPDGMSHILWEWALEKQRKDLPSRLKGFNPDTIGAEQAQKVETRFAEFIRAAASPETPDWDTPVSRNHLFGVDFSGYPMFQHITLGGQNTKGDSVINDLTHLCLEATAKVGMHQPSISVRWFWNCDDDFLLHAVKIASYGTGMPAFFNDEVLIPNMLQAGYSLQQARNYSIVGCTETSVGGISEPWLTGGFINLLKILELTIFDGYDPVSANQSSMQTGDVGLFASFEEFIDGYFKQLSHYLSLHVACDNILDQLQGKLSPNVFASVMINDCIKNAKSSLEGGAQFNSTTINAVGIANVADSLAVIKKFIYEEKTVSWIQLKTALLNNFEGCEDLRQTLINKSPKYGNDIEYVDELAQKVHEFLYEEFQKYQNPRGGKYFNALYSIACHVLFADKVGATPDGRKKGMVLADGGVSCSQGKDIKGPTALLNSVVKLNPYKAVGSTLLNMKFHPSIFAKEENYSKIASLLKTYFMMKGQHVQLNVIDAETLRNAQENPEKYASLVVRVAGFSVLFTTIDPVLQEDIILRTETRSGG